MLTFIKGYGLYKDGDFYDDLGQDDYYDEAYMQCALAVAQAANIEYVYIDFDYIDEENEELIAFEKIIKEALKSDDRKEIKKAIIEYEKWILEE